MSSSALTPQEVQASTTGVEPGAQNMESDVGGPVASSHTSATVSSKQDQPLSSSVNGTSTSDTPPCTSVSSSLGVIVPSTSAGPSTPRAPANFGSNAGQEPIQAKYMGSLGFAVPPPAFSYNILPRISPPSQSANNPVLNLNNRVPPAALQPPVPGQSITMRPSFSYSVVQRANAIPASGLQFQPAIVPSQVCPQSQVSGSSSQAPSSVHSLGSNPNVNGPCTQNSSASSQLPFSSSNGEQPTTTDFGGTSQSLTSVSSQKNASSNLGNVDSVQKHVSASSAANSQSTLSSTIGSSSSATVLSGSLANPSMPVASPFSRPPGTLGPSGTAVSHTLPSSASVSSSFMVRPAILESFRPVLPSSASTPPNSVSLPVPLQNVQQQTHQLYPSFPPVAPPSQALWLHPSLAGGVQKTPFVPYSGPVPAPYSLPVHNMPPVASMYPPGVPMVAVPGGTPPVAVAPGLVSSNATMKAPPSDNKQTDNPLHNEGLAKKEDADAWTAHKTETGVVYYYNSITGESTYERPASFKVEADKVTVQPTPVSWEKVAGTDWALVTTDDGKKYYYDTKNKVSSWQIPPEVAEVKNSQEIDSLNPTASSIQSAGSADKGPSAATLNTPALQSGGRDATALRSSGGVVSSSALDLVKRKLQDAGAPSTSSPLPVSSVLVGSNSDSPKLLDASNKSQDIENSNEKLKDANGDGNLSETSSDSEGIDNGPTKEECIIQFKEMLRERGIVPFSKWEKELPKIVFDPRFKAVPGYDARRSLFEQYVRNRAEEERKEKRAAQKAAVEGFKKLLEEASEDIDQKTNYQTFKRKWGEDPRFLALDRKEREVLLNERVISLKKAAEEKMQAARVAAVSSFKSMLRERGDITATTRWSRVKDSLRNDTRYRSVKHEEREVLFNEYLSELNAMEDKAEQAEKAKREEQEKLKRREQELRKRKQREEQEMEVLRLKARRKESEASYQALLVETIKDPKASWTESKPKLEKDPQGRFVNSGLELAEMEKLFREHVKNLLERCVHDFRSLLAEVITAEAASKVRDDGKSVLTSWTEAKNLLKPDPRYAKMPSKERETLWRKYTDELTRRQKSATNPSERPGTEGKRKSSSEHDGRPPRAHKRR